MGGGIVEGCRRAERVGRVLAVVGVVVVGAWARPLLSGLLMPFEIGEPDGALMVGLAAVVGGGSVIGVVAAVVVVEVAVVTVVGLPPFCWE